MITDSRLPQPSTAVICTHNRSALLAKCLDGLAAQEGIDDCFVMVVDNNSTDDTAEVCKSYASRLPCIGYIFESTPGLSAARNRGLAECETELIAYLDDDAIPEPGWLTAVLSAFEKTGADAVGGKIVPYWEGRRPWWISSGLYHLLSGVDLGTAVRALDGFYPTGANMAFKTDKLRQIGGFDVSLGMHSIAGRDATAYLGEETKIGMALSEIGCRVVYSGEAAVLHYADGSRCRLGALRARSRQVGRTCAMLGWPHTDMSAYDDEYVWAIGCAVSSALRLHPRDAVAFYLSAVIAGSASRELCRENGVRSPRALDVARAALRSRRGLLGLVRRTFLGPGIAPNA